MEEPSVGSFTDIHDPIVISVRNVSALAAVRHNLRRLDGRGVHKTIFPVIFSASSYSYRLTPRIHMKYASVILRYGVISLILVFAKLPRIEPSLIARDLSITLPVPSRNHVSVYSKDLQS